MSGEIFKEEFSGTEEYIFPSYTMYHQNVLRWCLLQGEGSVHVKQLNHFLLPFIFLRFVHFSIKDKEWGGGEEVFNDKIFFGKFCF